MSPRFIKTNILSNIYDDHFKNVTSRALKRFSFDLASGDLASDIKWPSFKLDLEIIKTNILSNIYDDYLKKKNDLWSVNKVFLWFGLVT